MSWRSRAVVVVMESRERLDRTLAAVATMRVPSALASSEV